MLARGSKRHGLDCVPGAAGLPATSDRSRRGRRVPAFITETGQRIKKTLDGSACHRLGMELAGIAGANGEPRGKFLQDANVSLDPDIGPLSGEGLYVYRYRAHTSSLLKKSYAVRISR